MISRTPGRENSHVGASVTLEIISIFRLREHRSRLAPASDDPDGCDRGRRWTRPEHRNRARGRRAAGEVAPPGSGTTLVLPHRLVDRIEHGTMDEEDVVSYEDHRTRAMLFALLALGVGVSAGAGARASRLAAGDGPV